MPPRIAFIPPDERIGRRARRVAAELGLDGASFIVREGVGEPARGNARELERDGTDVIITRGINLEVVRQAVKTPVVEVPVSGQDLATALHEAKIYTGLERPRIALLAFSSVQHDVAVFADLLGIDLRIYPVVYDLDLIRGQITRAKKDQAHVIVAGRISGDLAAEQGMPALMLDSGEVALRTAIVEAQKVAYARRLEKARTQRLQAVVDISQNGILVLDADGCLQAVNATARRILHLDAGLEGRKAAEALPRALVERCARCEEGMADELLEIHGVPLLLSVDLVKMGAAVVDMILTLQPVAAISELESKLRKSLHARGLTCQYSFADIWGVSAAIRDTMVTARSFAETDSPILLAGETGTGKELFAQAIHQVSPCASGPFVAINCAALPPSLLESELFGHEEGAFTGARRNGKPGLFEMAHNGTIFLDEISEMNHYGQTRLLRVLQERCTMRLGGDKYIPVNARVIAASNRNLPDLVRRGRFRQDLYYRLDTLPLIIPPLRERLGDVPYLARRFAEVYRKKYGSAFHLTRPMLDLLEGHAWPGNVRELAGIMERLALTARTAAVTESHVAAALAPLRVERPAAVRNAAGTPAPADGRGGPAERERILAALGRNRGHLGRAARDLGVHRTTLHRRMRALGICKYGPAAPDPAE